MLIGHRVGVQSPHFFYRKLKYDELRFNYYENPTREDQAFSVELISNLIEDIKKGKAAGLDGLTSEHLKYSHPILAVMICKLFNLFRIVTSQKVSA